MEPQESLWVLGDRYTFLLSTPAIAIIEIESGYQHGPPLHSHQQEIETLYVLEGELEVHRAGEALTVRKGAFLHFPKGMLHTFRTLSPEGSRILVTIHPGTLAQLFREIGTTDQGKVADGNFLAQSQRKLLDLSEHYGLRIER